MNRTSQPFFVGAHGGGPPAYEMLKEEHEVAVLGAPQNQAPVATTVINIRSETSVPDHIVWSLFNSLFMNWCCLGFVAFAYSVKVGGWTWSSASRSLSKILIKQTKKPAKIGSTDRMFRNYETRVPAVPQW
uniref:Interferon-induced transmembrane protein 3 n=1 Tax=Catagonus wagneri TaxID=51154 RepID=A0A8C3VSE5_9CETA